MSKDESGSTPPVEAQNELRMPGATIPRGEGSVDFSEASWEPFENDTADYPAVHPEPPEPTVEDEPRDVATSRLEAHRLLLAARSSDVLRSLYRTVDFSRLDSLSVWDWDDAASNLEYSSILSVLRTFTKGDNSKSSDALGVQLRRESGRIEQWLLVSRYALRMTYDSSHKGVMERCIRLAFEASEKPRLAGTTVPLKSVSQVG